jgi:mRNA interferase HigB
MVDVQFGEVSFIERDRGHLHHEAFMVYASSMRILSKSTLRQFREHHRDAEHPLRAWLAEAKTDEWKEPRDIARRYANARVIGRNRAVFGIKGNAYRLVVSINYDKGLVYVRFVGTHSQYDRIDALTV